MKQGNDQTHKIASIDLRAILLEKLKCVTLEFIKIEVDSFCFIVLKEPIFQLIVISKLTVLLFEEVVL